MQLGNSNDFLLWWKLFFALYSGGKYTGLILQQRSCAMYGKLNFSFSPTHDDGVEQGGRGVRGSVKTFWDPGTKWTSHNGQAKLIVSLKKKKTIFLAV